jgi:hypothetical protein
VVADAVSRAVNSDKPKRRYAVPFDAKNAVFAKWLLPDAIVDRLLVAAFKRAEKRARSGG